LPGFRIDRRQLLLAGAVAPLASRLAARTSRELDSTIAFANREIIDAGAGAPAVAYQIDQAMGEQAYVLRGSPQRVTVVAGDATGAMYGGLDIAEAVRTSPAALRTLLNNSKVRQPFVANRGLKFNIPLDMRTPSYGDGGDSNRANIPEVWERDFWATYFDEMARQRYNVMTLWSLHPFPSMVKVPEFPDVALDDVWRSREPLGPDIFDPRGNAAPDRFLSNYEVVKKISIDQKISFWRDVMEMARNRGIKVYIFTWNVFVHGTAGKYGITDAMTNPTTIAYTRASVRELIKTYPLLAGIGITAGENMGGLGRADAEEKERWLWATYGEGVREALVADPGRTVPLIHRFHETKGDTINQVWKAYPGFPQSFTFSHKYSIAHMYSTPRPRFFEREGRKSLDGKRSWITVRNDDIFSLRWGDPDYAREYVVNMPEPHVLVGFYMGPDGFCIGRDFLDRVTASKDLGSRRPLVIQKHWYSFSLWGRLAYDPQLPNSLFQAMLATRFPGTDAAKLYTAARAASQVIPRTTSFFWRDIDLMWFPEACVHNGLYGIRGYYPDKMRTEFYTVADFMIGRTAPDVAILNIREWRSRLVAGKPLVESSPLDAADGIRGAAEEALQTLAELRKNLQPDAGRELHQTLGDFEAMGHLGRYYSAKIRGACSLALYDGSGDPAQKADAVRYLQEALVAWKAYAAVHSSQYLPNFFSRIGWVDVAALTSDVAKDIVIARSWAPGTLK
jgi:hypothetical protein